MDTKEYWDRYLQHAGMELTSQFEDGSTPQMWLDADIPPAVAYTWRRVGGFDPTRVKEMIEAGLSPEDVRFETSAGGGGYTASAAYKFCNSDLELDQILATGEPTYEVSVVREIRVSVLIKASSAEEAIARYQAGEWSADESVDDSTDIGEPTASLVSSDEDGGTKT